MGKKRKPTPLLTIYYQNVRGLNRKEKHEEFLKNVQMHNHDVICLTETMLKSGFDSSLLFDDRYVVFRHDRNLQPTRQIPKPKKGGGGVLIAVKKELNPTLLILPNVSELGEAEDLWVTITLVNGKQIYICCAYIPGYRGIQMKSHLASLIANPTMIFNSILVGDYNIPKINFNAENASDDLLKEKRKPFREMAKFILEWGLQQFNHLINRNNVTLDLVLSLMKLIVIPATPLVRIDAHHPPILITLIEDDDSSSSDDELEAETRIFIMNDISIALREATKVPVETKSALTVAERDDIFVERKQKKKKKKEKVRIMVESEDERKENEEIYWEDIRILFAEKEAEGVKKEERDRIAEESEKESRRREKEERDRMFAEKEEERIKQEERDRETVKRESERKIEKERARIVAEKEAERKEQEERKREKEKKENERKIEEERVRIRKIKEKEAERKEQEERDNQRESERRSNNYNSNNYNKTAEFAGKLLVGVLVGTAVVAGVGICVASCPALIPALPAAGKTAVASTVAAKQALLFTAVAVGSAFVLLW